MLGALVQSNFVNPFRVNYTISYVSGSPYISVVTPTNNPNQSFSTIGYGNTKATGLTVQCGDGTIALGNPRTKGIDFQFSRSSATQVINSGDGVILCGNSNTAINVSYIFAGANNTLNTQVCSCVGYGNSAGGLGNAGTLLIGNSNGGGGAQVNSAYGANNSVGSVGGGNVAFGSYAKVIYSAGAVFANGQFAATGDCQTHDFIARATTTTTTPASASAASAFTSNITARTNLVILARTATATGSWAKAERVVTFTRGTTTSSLSLSNTSSIGTDVGSNAGAWPSGWNFNIFADNTIGAISVGVTGSLNTNIRWEILYKDYCELNYP